MRDPIIFSTLIVSGPDAASFLQGQLTCDLTQVTAQSSFGAYCDPRGRMIANFMIKKEHDNFYLILPHTMLLILEISLKKFAVFSKVTLTTDDTPIEKNRLELIKKGIAFITPETSLLFTPQMINWEQHGGVSFTKGCYVGQEVVARTQHLGKLKRHLHQLIVEHYDETTLPLPGTDLMNGHNEPIGVLCDAAQDKHTLHVLAVIQDDALIQKIQIYTHNAIIMT